MEESVLLVPYKIVDPNKGSGASSFLDGVKPPILVPYFASNHPDDRAGLKTFLGDVLSLIRGSPLPKESI